MTSGKPIENAFIESCSARLRDERLNVHQFESLAATQARIQTWRVDYNQPRPYTSLGHLTPNEFAEQRREDWTVESAARQSQPSYYGPNVTGPEQSLFPVSA